MENQKKNGQKGITLIALVVTIVVLIILATVSILAVFGDNGIIARAEKAKQENDYYTKVEEIKLAILGSYNNNGKQDHDILKDNLNKISWIKQSSKIEDDTEKAIEESVSILPFVVFTNDEKVVNVKEDGNVIIKAKPSKDLDINGDGIINRVDSEMIYKYVNRTIELTDEQKAKADVNGDSKINAADAAVLFAYINGKVEF